jgi:hypothetical protein
MMGSDHTKEESVDAFLTPDGLSLRDGVRVLTIRTYTPRTAMIMVETPFHLAAMERPYP